MTYDSFAERFGSATSCDLYDLGFSRISLVLNHFGGPYRRRFVACMPVQGTRWKHSHSSDPAASLFRWARRKIINTAAPEV